MTSILWQDTLSVSEELIFIILDTNIILHYLEVIDDFIADIQTLSLPMMIIIPGAVINELDGYVTLHLREWPNRLPSLQAEESRWSCMVRSTSVGVASEES